VRRPGVRRTGDIAGASRPSIRHHRPMSSHRHRVVVVGGGFAGLQAVRALKDAAADVTLVDRQNFHLFQPLAYQVATGALSSAEIAAPLRQVLRRQRNAHVVLAEVIGFDLDARLLHLDQLPNDPATSTLPYDILVVAGGSAYSYFGHDEWATHAPELKSLTGALDLRARILLAFEAAEVETDEALRREWLTLVVVGGGPTGVEMAGQIAELSRDTLRRDFRAMDTRQTRVLLIEASDRLLGTFPPSLSRKAARSLEKLGATPMLGTTVIGVGERSIEVRGPDGATSTIPARTAVWAAGVTASPLARLLAEAAGVEVDRAGRIRVEPDLTVAGHPEVFAIGDMVSVGDEQLPGLAPVAMQEGRHVAKSIRDGRREAFHYKDKGNLATIGRSRAVADLKGVHVSGLPAWLLWLGLHLFYLIGFQNRLLVLTRWTFSYVTRGRSARVIHR
jgi:NADH:ubiquinone reductase (H+-translocating)